MAFKNVLFIVLFSPFLAFAQVGINTPDPQGALDVVSSTEGMLIPRIALRDALDSTGMVNTPQEYELIFNTHTTTPAEATVVSVENHVKIGMYAWLNSRWNRVGDDIQVPSFALEYFQFGEILPDPANANSPGPFETIQWINTVDPATPHNSMTFTAPYDGVYQIIFSGNYGLDFAEDNNDSESIFIGYDFWGNPIYNTIYLTTNYAVGEGIFRVAVTIDGTLSQNIDKAATSISVNHDGTPDWSQYALSKYVTIIKNITLTAGQVCELEGQFDEIRLQNNTDESFIGYAVSPTYQCQLSVKLIGNN